MDEDVNESISKLPLEEIKNEEENENTGSDEDRNDVKQAWKTPRKTNADYNITDSYISGLKHLQSISHNIRKEFLECVNEFTSSSNGDFKEALLEHAKSLSPHFKNNIILLKKHNIEIPALENQAVFSTFLSTLASIELTLEDTDALEFKASKNYIQNFYDSLTGFFASANDMAGKVYMNVASKLVTGCRVHIRRCSQSALSSKASGPSPPIAIHPALNMCFDYQRLTHDYERNFKAFQKALDLLESYWAGERSDTHDSNNEVWNHLAETEEVKKLLVVSSLPVFPPMRHALERSKGLIGMLDLCDKWIVSDEEFTLQVSNAVALTRVQTVDKSGALQECLRQQSQLQKKVHTSKAEAEKERDKLQSLEYELTDLESLAQRWKNEQEMKTKDLQSRQNMANFIHIALPNGGKNRQTFLMTQRRLVKETDILKKSLQQMHRDIERVQSLISTREEERKELSQAVSEKEERFEKIKENFQSLVSNLKILKKEVESLENVLEKIEMECAIRTAPETADLFYETPFPQGPLPFSASLKEKIKLLRGKTAAPGNLVKNSKRNIGNPNVKRLGSKNIPERPRTERGSIRSNIVMPQDQLIEKRKEILRNINKKVILSKNVASKDSRPHILPIIHQPKKGENMSLETQPTSSTNSLSNMHNQSNKIFSTKKTKINPHSSTGPLLPLSTISSESKSHTKKSSKLPKTPRKINSMEKHPIQSTLKNNRSEIPVLQSVDRVKGIFLTSVEG